MGLFAILARAWENSVSTCDPCNIISLGHLPHSRLRWFVKYSTMSTRQQIETIISSSKADLEVTDDDTFDLTECCGATMDILESDMNLFSVRQLFEKAMLNLHDASRLSPKSGLMRIASPLNSTLCCLDTLAPPTATTDCLIASQIESCKNGMPPKESSCHSDMLIRFLLNAFNIFEYLQTSGRV